MNREQKLEEALRMLNCPRPCNHRPDEFSISDCVKAGECGCVAGAALSAPKAEAHPDDKAVDRFAEAMKIKLAQKRKEGRGGWWDDAYCSNSELSAMLREHVDKGDPLDVGNLAMMLHQRGERIAPAPKAEDLALGMDHVGKSLEASVKPEIDRLAGSIAPEAEAVSWDGMQSAPKDGSIVRLLVVPDPEAWTPFDDSHNPYETIGFNNLANTQEDRWEFAGWDWNQDCFITGQGEVIGWLPFHTSPVPTITDEAVERAAKAIHDGPLGANDEEDFGDNKASDWCREVARAALLAAFPSKGEGK